jgi:Zn-dependent peptidase ImmA (M78 family)
VTPDARALRRELRGAGLTTGAIDAVWPEWWSDAAEGSVSAAAELRYTIARRLGLSPGSLFEGPPRFVWRDQAKYKNLGGASSTEVGILSSFGVAVAQCALAAAPGSRPLPGTAGELRRALLSLSSVVGLGDLLAFCWAEGIPVIQLRLFPLARKRMHAMTVQVRDRFVILLGREAKFASQAAYFVAHEIGHIVEGHTGGLAALVDMDDPFMVVGGTDGEESAANRFALELLTGDPDPHVESNRKSFSAAQLAQAAMTSAESSRVDAGVLALCLAHATGRWAQAFGALKMIPPGEVDVGGEVNALARRELVWGSLALDAQDYLSKVMGEPIAS